MELIDPTLGLKLIIIGGWVLAALGALKVAVYLVGELAPGVYARIRSEGLRRFVTGNGNRLLFGIGGFLTMLLGLLFAALGYLIQWLLSLSR